MIIQPLGDAAILVREGAAEGAAQIEGVIEVTPAATSFAVFYDPRRTTYAAVARAVASLQQSEISPPTPRHHEIPVHYDGMDLADVARRTDLPEHEVIARHAGRTYTVNCLGFVPGFGYLGEVDPALVLPRRAEPRRRVPAGSVAIAGTQTAVYPFETPGGWHLIGRTDVVMFDVTADPPARLAAGDTVRFVPA